MALLDVNALVALVWDSHIHHVRIREWFAANASQGWAPLQKAGSFACRRTRRCFQALSGWPTRGMSLLPCAEPMDTGSYPTTCHSLTPTCQPSWVTAK